MREFRSAFFCLGEGRRVMGGGEGEEGAGRGGGSREWVLNALRSS